MKYDNSGIIYKNKDKEQPDANFKWSDYKGSITVEGVNYWLSGWIKKGEKGPFISLAVNKKEPKPGGGVPEDFDDDIPF